MFHKILVDTAEVQKALQPFSPFSKKNWTWGENICKDHVHMEVNHISGRPDMSRMH